MRSRSRLIAILPALVAAALLGWTAPHSTPPALAASAWTAPTALSDLVSGVRSPAIAVSASGAVHVVWQESSRIVHRLVLGGVPSAPQDAAYGYSPALAGGTGGDAYLAFAEDTEFGVDVFYSEWSDSAWSLPVNASLTGGAAGAPSIARSGDSLWLAWVDAFWGETQVWVAESSDGWAWNAEAVPGSQGAASASLSVGADGQPRVAWQAADLLTDRYDVFFAQRDPSGWSPADSVSDSTDEDSVAPRLVTVGSVSTLVWQETVGLRYEIRASSGTPGAWSAVATISQGTDDALAPGLAALPDGSILAAWTLPTETQARQSSAGTWLGVESVAVDSAGVSGAALAVGTDGSAHLVWSSTGATGGQRVMTSRRAASGPTPTPTSVTPTATRTPTRTATPSRTPSPTPTRTATPTTVPLWQVSLPVVSHPVE